jgi:pantothenate kinase
VRPPPANETTTTSNPQNDEPASAISLFAELKKLNEQINIREAIRAIKDLNTMLSSAKTKEQKFNVMLEFSTKINDYGRQPASTRAITNFECVCRTTVS